MAARVARGRVGFLCFSEAPPGSLRSPPSPFGGGIGTERYSRARLSLSAFATTLTDESAMAAAPITGESRMPNAG